MRLASLGLVRPDSGGATDAVRDLLAVQAQDYENALWAVGLRAAATRAEVQAAHEKAEFVRSWALRGTLHFVAPDDLVWLLGLTAERTRRTAALRHRRLGLVEDVVGRAADVAVRVLHGGRHVGRRALLAEFEAAGISTAGQRGSDLLLLLALRGELVLRGKDSWALVHECIPASPPLARDEALRQLAVRYFRSHGPATVRDLAWWSSLTLTDAHRAAAAAREALEVIQIDGTDYLMQPGLEPATGGVWLLPGFDEYLLGYADRSAPLAGARTDVIAPSRNGQFRPTIVVDGEVVGLWRRSSSATSTTVALEPFAPVPRAASAAVSAAERRYLAFLGRA